MTAHTLARAGSTLTKALRNGTIRSPLTGNTARSTHSRSSATTTASVAITSFSRGFHSTLPERNKPSSWGDLIPQPPRPSSSDTNSPLSKILARSSSPQYKRFGQNGSGRGSGGRGSGRGVPIFFDRRYQIVGGVVTVGAGGYYVVHLET